MAIACRIEEIAIMERDGTFDQFPAYAQVLDAQR